MQPVEAMRLDLHVHTYYSPDCLTVPAALGRAAAAHGLDGLAVTDHDAIDGAFEAQSAQGARDAGTMTVIVGEEIKTAEGEIIGLFLRERIPPRLSAEETIAAIRAQGGLVYVPHPFDRYRREAMGQRALERIVDQVDAIEVFNARMLFARDNVRALDFAEAHGLAIGAGSDAHTPYEVGRAYVEIEGFHDPLSFLAALRRGCIGGELTTPFIHAVSTVVRLCRPFTERPAGSR